LTNNFALKIKTYDIKRKEFKVVFDSTNVVGL